MHSRTKVVLWFVDDRRWKWEHSTRWQDFKEDAAIFLENHFDKGYTIYYTVNDETKELDYYNAQL